MCKMAGSSSEGARGTTRVCAYRPVFLHDQREVAPAIPPLQISSYIYVIDAFSWRRIQGAPREREGVVTRRQGEGKRRQATASEGDCRFCRGSETFGLTLRTIPFTLPAQWLAVTHRLLCSSRAPARARGAS